MSITNLTRSLLLALAVTLLLAPSVRGEPMPPSAHGEHDHEITPFIDPMQFNPDFQFFAPVDLGDFGNEPDPNTGWFADYKRAYVWVSRPERELSNTEGDYTWGNIFDLGYMTEDGSGWWVSGIHIDGPNETDTLLVPRIDRSNPDDVDPDDDPVFPPQDRNDPESNGRFFGIQRSLNIAKFSNIEINKVWRLDQLHSGGTLEPFIGFRYSRFRDETRRDAYRRLDEITGVPLPLPDDDTALIEELSLDTSYWSNDMFGGNLGVRWTERKSRWMLSSELRMFALQNFQNFNNRRDTFQLLYDGVGPGSATAAEKFTRVGFSTHDAEFVWGADIRAEAAFELTRDLNLMVGAQVLHFVQGIARGEFELFNDEDLQMAGVTFGFQVNR